LGNNGVVSSFVLHQDLKNLKLLPHKLGEEINFDPFQKKKKKNQEIQFE